MEKEECKHCGKKFDSVAALRQHQNVKHATEVKESPKETKRVIRIKKTYIIALILLIAIFGGTFYFTSFARVHYTPLIPYSEHVRGSPNANVTMVIYSDFQCPVCGRFAREILPQIESNYVDTGKVKLIFKQFPITSIHNFAQKAAEASECAADQGKFWEYHDRLYQNQTELTISDLKQYASELELNTTLFDECLTSGYMSSIVKKYFQ